MTEIQHISRTLCAEAWLYREHIKHLTLQAERRAEERRRLHWPGDKLSRITSELYKLANTVTAIFDDLGRFNAPSELGEHLAAFQANEINKILVRYDTNLAQVVDEIGRRVSPKVHYVLVITLFGGNYPPEMLN